MKLHFFQIPVFSQNLFEDELNKFLASHRITHIEKEFVSNGSQSFWSVCVTSIDGEPRRQKTGQKRRVDYREVLDEKDFAIYVKLRNLRKTLSEKEGVPAYALFTNEQLAEMVTNRVNTKSGMFSINGVGESKWRKYGESFIPIMFTKERVFP